MPDDPDKENIETKVQAPVRGKPLLPVIAFIGIIICLGGLWWTSRHVQSVEAENKDLQKRLAGVRKELDSERKTNEERISFQAEEIQKLNDKINKLNSDLAAPREGLRIKEAPQDKLDDKVFEELESRVRTFLDVQDESSALRAVDDFLKNHPGGDLAVKTRQLRQKVLESRMGMFEEDCRQPNSLVAEYRFAEAKELFSRIIERYAGTHWSNFAAKRLQSIELQEALHNKVIERIKQAARENEKHVIEFHSDKLPQGKLVIVDVSNDGMMVAAENDTRFKKKVFWKEIPAGDVYGIYMMFIPKPVKEDNLQLANFCQERELLDEAEKHFELAGE